MNFLSGLFLSPPSDLPTQQKMEWKKSRLGVERKDEIHKLALGFFLDRYTAFGDEKKAMDQLSRFEWFAGSISAQRLGIELEGFLNSDLANQLDPLTVKQIQEVIKLLHAAQEQSSALDVVRSNGIPLTLIAITGNEFFRSTADAFFSPDEKEISYLAESAHQKVLSLRTGERALFLVGTLLHESLLVIEKKNDDLWEVAFYDTGTSKRLSVYTVQEDYLEQKFWQMIYTCKFSGGDVPGLIATNEQEKGEAIEYAKAPMQRKNTCHISSLLAVVKDFIVRRSDADLNFGITQWREFQVLFGEHLIAENVIEDPSLLELVGFKQDRRSQKFEQMRLACCESDYETVCQGYQKIAHFFGSDGPKKDPHPIEYLKNCHRWLISLLENRPINPEQFRQLFKDPLPPLVAYSVATFEERYQRREAEFKQQLAEELQLVTSEWNLFVHKAKESFGNRPDQAEWAITGIPLNERDVDMTLSLLLKNPKGLKDFWHRRALNGVLLLAMQLGKLDEVNAIYQLLEESEKIELELRSENISFIPALFCDTMEAQLTRFHDTPLFKPIVTALCEMHLKERNFEKFLKLANACKTNRVVLTRNVRDIEILEEEVLPILETLMELHQNNREVIFSQALLEQIAETANPKVTELLEPLMLAFLCTIPGFDTMCRILEIRYHIGQGEFTIAKMLIDRGTTLRNVTLKPLEFSNENIDEAIVFFEGTAHALPGSFFVSLISSLLKLGDDTKLIQLINSPSAYSFWNYSFGRLDLDALLYLLSIWEENWIKNDCFSTLFFGCVLQIDQFTLNQWNQLNNVLEKLHNMGYEKEMKDGLNQINSSPLLKDYVALNPSSLLAKHFQHC